MSATCIQYCCGFTLNMPLYAVRSSTISGGSGSEQWTVLYRFKVQVCVEAVTVSRLFNGYS